MSLAGEVGGPMSRLPALAPSRTRARSVVGSPRRSATLMPKLLEVGLKINGAPSSSSAESAPASTGPAASGAVNASGVGPHAGPNARVAAARRSAREGRQDMHRLREAAILAPRAPPGDKIVTVAAKRPRHA